MLPSEYAVILQDIHIVDNDFEENAKYVATLTVNAVTSTDLQLFDGLSFFAND